MRSQGPELVLLCRNSSFNGGFHRDGKLETNVSVPSIRCFLPVSGLCFLMLMMQMVSVLSLGFLLPSSSGALLSVT